MKKFDVTIPTRNEIENLVIPMTDYAIATGGRIEFMHKTGDNERQDQYGECWLRDLGKPKYFAQTYRWFAGAAKFRDREVDNEWLGVTPRLVNPEHGKFGFKILNERNVLTYKDHAVTYPQKRVGVVLAERLSAARDSESADLIPNGGFARPSGYTEEHQEFNYSYDRCYQYNGKNYVNVYEKNKQDSWFLCQPVDVVVNADQSLQCSKMLFAAMLDERRHFREKNIEHFRGAIISMRNLPLGKFLNGDLVANFENSPRLNKKLAKPKNFNRDDLRIVYSHQFLQAK